MTFTHEDLLKLLEIDDKNIEIPDIYDSIDWRAFRFPMTIPDFNSLIIPNSIMNIDDADLDNCDFEHIFIPKSITKLGRNAIRATNVYFEDKSTIGEFYKKTEFFQGNNHDEAYAFDFHRGGCSAQDDRYEVITYNVKTFASVYDKVTLEEFRKIIKQ